MDTSFKRVVGNRCRGRYSALAITVGITALAITVATSDEYWAWSIIPCERPNNAEMVPNVSPVDIRRVVYIASLFGAENSLVTGYTPTIFVPILTARKNRNAAGAATSAGIETNEPARMK